MYFDESWLGKWIIRVYVFLILVLLPMDWFGPTGVLLREAGAKPAIPLLLLGTLLTVLVQPSILLKLDKPTLFTALALFAVFMLGSIAFEINLFFSWSDFNGTKNPVTQFLGQSVLFLLSLLVIVVHVQLFRDRSIQVWVLTALPIAAVIHLSVIGLEAAGVLNGNSGPLLMFRPNIGDDRLSGLMSEPSYYGTFASLYGAPLVFIRNVPRYRFRCALGILLFVSAVLVRAKTFIPVLLCDILVIAWSRGRRILRLKYVIAAIIAASVCLYVIIANAALNLSDNLSSINRIGSTVLALKASLRGYAITGIGFGQFHFFFRKEFAPSFLLLSPESATQFSRYAEFRASTFNLFARLLLETGVLGLVLFLGVIYKILKTGRFDMRAPSQVGLLFVAGSIGFLYTQDTYFYPPLIFGVALVLGSSGDRLRHETVETSVAFHHQEG